MRTCIGVGFCVMVVISAGYLFSCGSRDKAIRGSAPTSSSLRSLGNLSVKNNRVWLGRVVASNQVIKVKYELYNHGLNKIVIRNIITFSPCCTAVESFSPFVDSGKSGEVIVRFKTGLHSGVKNAGFEILTDETTASPVKFFLGAEFMDEIEITESSLRKQRKADGHTVFLKDYEVVCRRDQYGGKGGFDNVDVDAPWRLVTDRKLFTQTRKGSILEEHASLTIALSDSVLTNPQEVGRPDRSSIRFRWNDGTSTTRRIGWRNSQRQKTRPPSFLIKDRPIESSSPFVFYAEDDSEPFCIMAVDCENLIDNGCIKLVYNNTFRGKKHELKLYSNLEFCRNPGIYHLKILTSNKLIEFETLIVVKGQ